MTRRHLTVALLATLAAVSACDRDTGSTDAAREAPANPPPATTTMPGATTAPAAMPVDDAAITARVKAALMGDPTLGGLTIDVASAAGVVSLKGQVNSAAARDRAGIVARETDGVVAIDNQITVSSGS